MIKKFLDLGYQPIANSFLKSKKEFNKFKKTKKMRIYKKKNFKIFL